MNPDGKAGRLTPGRSRGVGRRTLGLTSVAFAVAGGFAAALANFVGWPVAFALGALSGAATMYGAVQWQRHTDSLAREREWRAAVGDGPAGRSSADAAGVLISLLPE